MTKTKVTAVDAIPPSDYIEKVKLSELEVYFEHIKTLNQKWRDFTEHNNLDHTIEHLRLTVKDAKKLLAAYKFFFLYSEAFGDTWALVTRASKQEIEELEGYIDAEKRNLALNAALKKSSRKAKSV